MSFSKNKQCEQLRTFYREENDSYSTSQTLSRSDMLLRRHHTENTEQAGFASLRPALLS